VVFEVLSREVSGPEFELLVVGLERQQVVSFLDILPLEFTTGMGEVVALRRGGTIHGLSSVVLVFLQAARGGFLGVVTEVVFMVVIMVGKMA
jgi:nicotinamide riboside transporter PnuC